MPDRAGRRLGPGFFDRPAEQLAQALLGQRLVRVMPDGTRLAGLVVETEAYLGIDDPASHSHRGRHTPRNHSMYARGGTAYVYFTYGMHFCMNVVASTPGDPAAVLLRALEPTEGLSTMHRHRAASRARSSKQGNLPLPTHLLCSGPARLCQALAIDRDLDGIDLTTDSTLFLEAAPHVPADLLRRGPRIGIDAAGEPARSWPLRFWVDQSPHVSRPGPGRTPASEPKPRRNQ